MRKILITNILIAILSLPVYATTIIGNWENGSSDGWTDWIENGNNASITAPVNASKYSFSTIGATLGSESLQVTQTGWNQDLTIRLQNNGLISDFLANTTLQMDVTYPATSVGGWEEIYDVYLNASHAGWNSIAAANPIPGSHVNYGPGGGPQQTITLSFDYSQYLSKIGSNPSYVEFIICTNSDDNHGVFYFDNVRLTSSIQSVPEPATIVLLGLGLVLFRKRS